MVIKDYLAPYRRIEEVAMECIPQELIEYGKVHVMVKEEFISETVHTGEV